MTPRRPAAAIPMDSLFGYTLRRLSVSLMGGLARRLSELDLRIAEASVLITVGQNEGITQIEVGRALGIQRANMAPLTAGLVARKLVAREAADGRSHALQLTSDGQALAARALEEMRRHDRDFTSGLSPQERKQAIALLRRITESLDGDLVYEPARPNV